MKVDLTYLIQTIIIASMYTSAVIIAFKYAKQRSKEKDKLERYRIQKSTLSDKDKKEIMESLRKDVKKMIHDEIISLMK